MSGTPPDTNDQSILTDLTRARERELLVMLVEDDDGDALLVEELLHDGLPDARWETTSTCPDWTVRDVLSHMTSTALMTPPKFLLGFAGSAFNFDRFAAKGKSIGRIKNQRTPFLGYPVLLLLDESLAAYKVSVLRLNRPTHASFIRGMAAIDVVAVNQIPLFFTQRIKRDATTRHQPMSLTRLPKRVPQR